MHALDDRARALHRRLENELEQLVSGHKGVSLEVKPASVAVHVRKAQRGIGDRALAAVRSGPATWDGVQVTEGKKVIELAVVQTDKGRALDVLRRRVSATAAIFLGDDVTDEKAFARLSGPDIGVKVGPGESLAQFQINDTVEVATVLAFLLEERRTWLFGEQAPPIERLTMLSNGQQVALLTPDARVTWMCHPEPDSAAVFADLLGGRAAGHFSIRPYRNGLPLGQRYLPGTMTVETRWPQLLVTDYLVHLDEDDRTDLIRTISGQTRAVVEFVPRPEFGQVSVQLEADSEGLRVLGTSDPMVLRSPGVNWEIISDEKYCSARAMVDPSAGDILLELRCGTNDLAPSPISETERRRRAAVWWSDWVSTLTLPKVQTELVAHRH